MALLLDWRPDDLAENIFRMRYTDSEKNDTADRPRLVLWCVILFGAFSGREQRDVACRVKRTFEMEAPLETQP